LPARITLTPVIPSSKNAEAAVCGQAVGGFQVCDCRSAVGGGQSPQKRGRSQERDAARGVRSSALGVPPAAGPGGPVWANIASVTQRAHACWSHAANMTSQSTSRTGAVLSIGVCSTVWNYPI